MGTWTLKLQFGENLQKLRNIDVSNTEICIQKFIAMEKVRFSSSSFSSFKNSCLKCKQWPTSLVLSIFRKVSMSKGNNMNMVVGTCTFQLQFGENL